MHYIDGYVIAVPNGNRADYEAMTRKMAAVFKKHGALRIMETWGRDVPEGKETSFPLAVKCKDDETVVFSCITWPDKATRDSGWAGAMQEPEMKSTHASSLFDGKRMIFGGFDVIIDE